jgi:hypothetical protein
VDLPSSKSLALKHRRVTWRAIVDEAQDAPASAGHHLLMPEPGVNELSVRLA